MQKDVHSGNDKIQFSSGPSQVLGPRNSAVFRGVLRFAPRPLDSTPGAGSPLVLASAVSTAIQLFLHEPFLPFDAELSGHSGRVLSAFVSFDRFYHIVKCTY